VGSLMISATQQEAPVRQKKGFLQSFFEAAKTVADGMNKPAPMTKKKFGAGRKAPITKPCKGC